MSWTNILVIESFDSVSRHMKILPRGSTSSVDLQQKEVSMESQMQALIAYISAKEGGRIPEVP